MDRIPHGRSVLATILVPVLGAVAPGPAAAQLGLCGEWSAVSTPEPETGSMGSSQLRDVFAIAPDDVWAVGFAYMGLPTSETHTLAMHWDGSSWTIVPTPSPSPTISALYAVEARASDDVWAAGVKEIFNPFRELHPLVMHWDGTSWEEVLDSTLEAAVSVVYTIEIVGPDDVWFGGDLGLTLHWDGSGFDAIPVPTFDTGNCSGTAGCGHAVVDIAAVTPDDVWAVGGAADGDYSFVSQIWHWDGQGWTHEPGPSIPYYQRLNGVVALATDDVWAVGNLDAADPDDPGLLVIHWDGTQWSRVPTPLFEKPFGDLQDVMAFGPDDIWAAGIYTDAPPPAAGLPLTMHYDGADWIQVDPDPDGPAGAWLRGLTAAGSCDFWSVGSSVNSPYAQRFQPGTPSLRLASFDGADECAGGAGDANGVWEPGEQVTVAVDLGAFFGSFTGVEGTLTTSSPGVTILDGTATWTDIPEGIAVTSEAPHFLIRIDPAVACGTALDFDLSVTATQGGPFPVTFRQVVGDPIVLSGPAALIPDNNPIGATSTVAVTEDVTLSDLKVRVEIDHNWVSDIKIELESPAGTRITLLDRPGIPATVLGCGNDDMNVTFDDASTYYLEDHCEGTTPWYSGVAAPVQPLSTFQGESTAGTWKLIVSDNSLANAGWLLGWDFIPTPAVGGVCNVCEPATGAPDVTGVTPFSLAPVRPNPFGASAEVAFTLDRGGRTRLDLFDVAGRRIRTLVDGELPPGRHALAWDGRDAQGDAVAAGAYFVRLTNGGRSELRRIVRLR